MPLILQKDSSYKYDFIAQHGKSVTVKVAGKNGSVGFINPLFNANSVAVSGNKDTVSFTLALGVNVFITGMLAAVDEVITLSEIAGVDSKVLESFTNSTDPLTGAPDPVTGFNVFAF